VVVAVSAMGVMQVPGDQIVDVVPVRERLVPAALAVLVSGGVPAAGVVRHAPIGIGPADRKPMVVDVSVVQVVQVPVVEIIGVSLVADRRVAAAASVNMPTVVAMLRTAHGIFPPPGTLPHSQTGEACSNRIRDSL
jgi:hypothetical protein